jgi:DinB superfamily
VEGDPDAQLALARLGVNLVPAVAVGRRAVHGWNPAAYAELLGIAYAPPEKLTPAVLSARLDRFLERTQSLIAVMPAEHLDHRPPQRDRAVRDLAFHVFRLGLAFADGMDMGRFPEGWLQERAPADLRDGPSVARYGALVRGRLSGWFEGAGTSEYGRVIDVYYGPQSGHDLLERTTWHAAQHLRQLYALAGELGVRPPRPLPAEDFEGLPLPASLW